MKIRNGFVSNSSSSSFLIALENKPKTVKKLHYELFQTDEIQVFYDDVNDGEAYTSLQVAQYVKKIIFEFESIIKNKDKDDKINEYFWNIKKPKRFAKEHLGDGKKIYYAEIGSCPCLHDVELPFYDIWYEFSKLVKIPTYEESRT